jgi:hypothetical protein
MLPHSQEAFELGEACILPQPFAALKMDAFSAVDQELGAMLSDSGLKSWNAYGMRRFDTDIDVLLSFAGHHKHERLFARIDDLRSFLSREQWHLAANPDHLMSSYPRMDPLLVRSSFVPGGKFPKSFRLLGAENASNMPNTYGERNVEPAAYQLLRLPFVQGLVF